MQNNMEIHQRRPTRHANSSNGGDASTANDIDAIAARGNEGEYRVSTSSKNKARSSNAFVLGLVLIAIVVIYLIIEPHYFNIASSKSGTSSGLRRKSSLFLLRNNHLTVNPSTLSLVRTKLKQTRDEFYHRYGSKETATKMLQRGLRTFERSNNNRNSDNDKFGGSIRATANRFLSAIVRHEASSSSQHPSFVMAFAGYSVTVGRGNHREQSYPFVLEKILSPLLELPPFNIKLIVRNSAIGGIPSFPYGWCLRNFLGDDADLVSWDYGMNEGNEAAGLESYIRQSLVLPKSPPLFVMLDTKTRSRLDILQRYVDLGVLPDPLALGGKDAVDAKLLALSESERPEGLQNWDEWGAPKGAPGQSPWHAKRMEHELMAWMLAMRMIDALEVALNMMESDVHWRIPTIKLLEEKQTQDLKYNAILPPPVTNVSTTGVPSLLHGIESTTNTWRMERISCRTSFLPNIYGDLNSIVQSGVTIDDTDMLQPRDDRLFNGGWVMDVGKLERDTKLKVQSYGGLGYIDMKTALYGIPSSGTLKFWLPYEGSTDPIENSYASEYFSAVVICEVNEKRGNKECNMLNDLEFRVGGAIAPRRTNLQVKNVASYLKKDICIRVMIPTEAKISKKSGSSVFGVSLDVTVTGNSVTREDGACSISHVVWENREPG